MTYLSGFFLGLFVDALRRRDIDNAVVCFAISCSILAVAMTRGHFFT